MLDYNQFSDVIVERAIAVLGSPSGRNSTAILDHNLIRLIQRFSWIPDPEIQLPVVAACISINSMLLKQKKLRVPYLFHFGPAGTGKSQVAIVSGLLYDLPVFAADSSAAGLRQHLEEVSEDARIFKFLLFDDLNTGSFDGEDGRRKLTIFKCGYDPLTGTITLGGKEGKPVKLDVFCPKIFSSCFPFHSTGGFTELMRRSLVIQHRKNESIDLDSVHEMDWDGCAKALDELWLPGGKTHLRFEAALGEVKKGIKNSNLDSNKKIIAPALICTGVAMNIWNNVPDAISAFERFCEYEKNAYSQKSSFSTWLHDWILVNGKPGLHATKRGVKVHFFSSKEVLAAAETAYENGEFMEKFTRELLVGFLEDATLFGYRLLGKAASSKYYQEAVWLKEMGRIED